MGDLLKLVRTLAWAALVAAIYQELKKQPEERTWHGRVAGTVPYDFRVPTLEKFREAYWAPDTDRVYADASAQLRADARARLRRGNDAP